MMKVVGMILATIMLATIMIIIGATMMLATMMMIIGATMMMIIGGSGGGPWQRPIGATEVPLVPHNRRVRGERNIVVFVFVFVYLIFEILYTRRSPWCRIIIDG